MPLAAALCQVDITLYCALLHTLREAYHEVGDSTDVLIIEIRNTSSNSRT
jgi:hypothetical protein